MVITKANYEEEVVKSDKPVLLDFWASWCGPCKMLAPIMEEIEKEYADEIKVGKINVDEEIELAQQFKVASIPTVVLMKDGMPVETSIGYRPKEDIVDMFR